MTIDTAMGPFCIAVRIAVSFLAKKEYREILPIVGVTSLTKLQLPTCQSPEIHESVVEKGVSQFSQLCELPLPCKDTWHLSPVHLKNDLKFEHHSSVNYGGKMTIPVAMM